MAILGSASNDPTILKEKPHVDSQPTNQPTKPTNQSRRRVLVLLIGRRRATDCGLSVIARCRRRRCAAPTDRTSWWPSWAVKKWPPSPRPPSPTPRTRCRASCGAPTSSWASSTTCSTTDRCAAVPDVRRVRRGYLLDSASSVGVAGFYRFFNFLFQKGRTGFGRAVVFTGRQKSTKKKKTHTQQKKESPWACPSFPHIPRKSYQLLMSVIRIFFCFRELHSNRPSIFFPYRVHQLRHY